MAKDHYVMKSHLDKFVHPSSARKILYPYRKGGGLRARNGIGPKGLGYANNFYSQTLDDGNKTDQLDIGLKFTEEAFFASGKGSCGTLARCIFDASFFPTTPEERTHIAFCTAVTFLRSPVQIHNVAMIRHMEANLKAYHKLFEGGKRQDDKDAIMKGDIEASIAFPDEREDGLKSLHIAGDLAVLIDKMRWRILEAPEHCFFLTSDNPVNSVDTSCLKFKSVGIGDDTAELWYPISHRFGIKMDWKQLPQGRFAIGHSETRSLNRRMITRAYKNIYSPLCADWIQEAALDDNFCPLLGRCPPWSMLHDIPAKTPMYDRLRILEQSHPQDVFANMKMY